MFTANSQHLPIEDNERQTAAPKPDKSQTASWLQQAPCKVSESNYGIQNVNSESLSDEQINNSSNWLWKLDPLLKAGNTHTRTEEVPEQPLKYRSQTAPHEEHLLLILHVENERGHRLINFIKKILMPR